MGRMSELPGESSAANDMPAYSGGEGPESSACPCPTSADRSGRGVLILGDGDDRRVMADQDRVAV
jgi:hypothetical protein